MNRRVSRAERVRDLAAAGLLAAGLALYAYAYSGMRALASGRGAAERELFGSIARYNQYWTVSRAGLIIAAVGLIIGAWSYWRHARRQGATPP